MSQGEPWRTCLFLCNVRTFHVCIWYALVELETQLFEVWRMKQKCPNNSVFQSICQRNHRETFLQLALSHKVSAFLTVPWTHTHTQGERVREPIFYSPSLPALPCSPLQVCTTSAAAGECSISFQSVALKRAGWAEWPMCGPSSVEREWANPPVNAEPFFSPSPALLS